MSDRLVLSDRVFRAGLLLVLLAGVASATRFGGDGMVFPLLTLAGGAAAVAGRLWHRRLRRQACSANHFTGLGNYPLDLLRSPRFVSGQ